MAKPKKDHPLMRTLHPMASLIILSFGIVILVCSIFFLSRSTTSSSHPIKSSVPLRLPGWKVYENNKISISYPPDWIITINSQVGDHSVVRFRSKEYQQSEVGYPAHGYTVGIFIKNIQWTGTQGLKWTQEVQWEHHPATLQKYTFDANDIVLMATFNGSPVQMDLSSAPGSNPEDYSTLLLQAANTLKIK